MNRTVGVSTASMIMVALLVAACDRQESKPAPVPQNSAVLASARQVVKLGFAAPLTGSQSHYGKEMQNGIVLALEEINAQPPQIDGKLTRFELVSEDDQADPKQATVVAQKLIDAKIAGVLGHFNSGTSIPASRLYAEAGIPQIAMATAPAYTAQGFKTTFRAMTSDTQQGGVMGRYVVAKLGAKRIAIIDDRSAYGQGLADEFEKSAQAAGGEIVRREFTSDKATDFGAILTAVKSAQADIVFFGGADGQAGLMARQIRSLAIKATLVGGEMVKSPSFIKLAGTAAEGTVASLAGAPLAEMPGGRNFAARYQTRFGTPVEIYAPYAFDAAHAMVAAMQRANSADPARYLSELAKTQMAGVTSAFLAYDEKGDLKDGAITIYRVEAGEWKALETAAGR